MLRLEEGSLYPALHRMEDKCWVKAAWGTSENNRRAKYYELTSAGRQRLRRETADWNRLVAAIDAALRAEREEA